MRFFRNLSIKYKLTLLVLLPLLLAIAFIVTALTKSWTSAKNMETAQVLLSIASSSNSLIHELQKERGASAVYLSSKGQSFEKQLIVQRALTNSFRERFFAQLEMSKKLIEEPTMTQHLTAIENSLAQLDNIRAQVNRLSISTADALGYYTMQNALMLKTTFFLTEKVKDREIASLSSSYYYFLQGKERAGIERAVLSTVLGFDKATPAQKERYITLAVEQNSYLELFRQKATQESIDFVGKTLTGKAIDEVARIREVAVLKNEGFGVEAAYWFDQATQRINLLKKSEEHVAESLQTLVEDKEATESASFIQLLSVALVLLASTIALSIFTQRLIESQLKDLSSAMTALGENSDLDVRIEKRSEDDLGQLTETFNNTVTNIRKLISNMRDASEALQNVSDTLNEVSGDVVLKVEQGLQETESVAAAMHQMGTTVQDVANNCSTAAGRSSEANNSAQSGSSSLEQAGSNMMQLIENLSKTKDTIQLVAQSSNEINSILDVIKNIAEQTNLLALNAAIEAARAGDQGRGFAVVADEVRSLAQKTQDSTLQIEQMIVALQEGSQNAVTAVVDSEASADYTNKSVDDILGQLHLIIEQVQSVNDLNSQNATATDQQTSTVHEINTSIDSIQQRYVANRDSITIISDTSGQMNDLSQKLAMSVNQFKMS